MSLPHLKPEEQLWLTPCKCGQIHILTEHTIHFARELSEARGHLLATALALDWLLNGFPDSGDGNIRVEDKEKAQEANRSAAEHLKARGLT